MSWLSQKLPLIFDQPHSSAQRLHIPIFALNTVLYPDGVLFLKVFEAHYMDMARTCMKANTPFGVCLIRAGNEVGAAAETYLVGTLATIADWDMAQFGILNITAHGGQRFLIESSQIAPDGLITATVSLIPVEPIQLIEQDFAICSRVFDTIFHEVGAARFSTPIHPEQAAWLGYRLAESLPIKVAAKQDLLEMNDSLMRLKILWAFLKRQGVQG